MFSRFNRSILIFIRSVEASGAKRYSNLIASQEYVCNSEDNKLSEVSSGEVVEGSKNKLGRRIPLTIEEFKELRKLKPCQPENPHLLKVSILGEPNVGKSTLTNNLVKWKVCAVSRKVHTTRKKATAVLVEQNKQIVFLDTPGFVSPEITKKHYLEPSFVMDPVRSIQNADIIAVVIDISNKWTNCRINDDILRTLEDFKEKKSILVLNKVDAMKSKGRILHIVHMLTGGMVGGIKNPVFQSQLKDTNMPMEEIARLIANPPQLCENDLKESQKKRDEHKGWTSFSRVFMVSALKDTGMDELREYFLSEALPRDWIYHDNTITDQHPHEVALTIVREKLLEYLPEEIPYKLDLKVSKWEMLSTGCPKININIVCSNSRHKRFVIGPAGKHIAACAEKSRLSMREAFRKDVVLHIAVV